MRENLRVVGISVIGYRQECLWAVFRGVFCVPGVIAKICTPHPGRMGQLAKICTGERHPAAEIAKICAPPKSYYPRMAAANFTGRCTRCVYQYKRTAARVLWLGMLGSCSG